VSTPSLVREIARTLGVAPRLVAVPPALLRVAGALTGKRDTVARLVDSLEVDPSSLARATGWKPRPFAIDTATLVQNGDARDL
jgi:UDP-glucose 4-epimerase